MGHGAGAGEAGARMTVIRITDDQAVAVDLGRKHKAEVRSSVPFIVLGVQHCAGEVHVIGSRHREVLIRRLNDREGTVKVWPRGSF